MLLPPGDNTIAVNKYIIYQVTVIVRKGLKRNLEGMPGKHSIDSLHKTAVAGT